MSIASAPRCCHGSQGLIAPSVGDEVAGLAASLHDGAERAQAIPPIASQPSLSRALSDGGPPLDRAISRRYAPPRGRATRAGGRLWLSRPGGRDGGSRDIALDEKDVPEEPARCEDRRCSDQQPVVSSHKPPRAHESMNPSCSMCSAAIGGLYIDFPRRRHTHGMCAAF